MIAADMTARISSPVFVGRALELATLEAALEKAEGRSAGIVLIAGEAGIGKSRLVAELAGQARDRGGVVLEGGCISLASDEGLPFGPIAEALRGLVRRTEPEALQDLLDPGMGELARLVPELTARSAGASLASPPEWAQTRLFEGFLSLLARLGERQPVLLVLEDLHWADRSTRDLLAFVARHVRQERVLIVGTYRSDELHRRHPLRPWLAEMERLATVDRLGLSRFGRDELAAQLAAIEGEPVSAGLLEPIERRSEGNPLFAEEPLASRPIGSSNEVPEKLPGVPLRPLATHSQEAPPAASGAAGPRGAGSGVRAHAGLGGRRCIGRSTGRGGARGGAVRGVGCSPHGEGDREGERLGLSSIPPGGPRRCPTEGPLRRAPRLGRIPR